MCKRKQSETERRERNRVAETGVVEYGERCEVRSRDRLGLAMVNVSFV